MSPPKAAAAKRIPLGTFGRAGVVLALAVIAGFVDAVGYLLLVQVYTSHMTGNTAALGQHLSSQQWHAAVLHAWPILTFVIGLLVGACLTEIGRRARIHSRLSMVMVLEAILLGILGLWGAPHHPDSIWWVALPALAMGMQTVTVTRVGDQRVYSTYITGSLSKFAEALAGLFFWVHDRRRQRGTQGWLRETVRHRLAGHALLTGGLWVAFLGGGLFGTWSEIYQRVYSIWWPVVGLMALVILDLRRPIAAVSEHEPLGFEA